MNEDLTLSEYGKGVLDNFGIADPRKFRHEPDEELEERILSAIQKLKKEG